MIPTAASLLSLRAIFGKFSCTKQQAACNDFSLMSHVALQRGCFLKVPAANSPRRRHMILFFDHDPPAHPSIHTARPGYLSLSARTHTPLSNKIGKLGVLLCEPEIDNFSALLFCCFVRQLRRKKIWID
jgi:hypothetical protein